MFLQKLFSFEKTFLKGDDLAFMYFDKKISVFLNDIVRILFLEGGVCIKFARAILLNFRIIGTRTDPNKQK